MTLVGWLTGAKTPANPVNGYSAIFDQVEKEFVESQNQKKIDSNEYQNL